MSGYQLSSPLISTVMETRVTLLIIGPRYDAAPQAAAPLRSQRDIMTQELELPYKSLTAIQMPGVTVRLHGIAGLFSNPELSASPRTQHHVHVTAVQESKRRT